MPKTKLTEEQLKELDENKDLTAFEKYCGSCDNFETENCPLFGEVHKLSEWKNIGCENFWDYVGKE